MCIFNYDGLQIADFFSAFTSILITLMSMSGFKRSLKVFCFFVGLLASISVVLYDRFSMVALSILISIFALITVFSWVSKIRFQIIIFLVFLSPTIDGDPKSIP